MRKLLLAASLVVSSPLYADVPRDPPPHTEEHKEEAHEGEHAAAAHAEAGHGAEHGAHHEEEGIVNWWSWDYGASAQDPEHKDWPAPFGWALINFGVFLYILSRILWRPMKAGMIDRHEKIKSELDEASRLRKEAEGQLAEFTKKVANADHEVEVLLQQLRKEAQADRARIIATAEAEAQRLRTEADRQIQVEIERARAELRKETVEAALKAAEELLRSKVSADDQRQLAERYVSSVEKARSTGGVA